MTETTDRAALIAEAAEYPTNSDWCGNLIQDLAAALADAERDLAKAWYEGWCAGDLWGYWVELEDPANHIDVSISANPYGDYTPPENKRESNWPTDA